jgi:signal recognition particle receptor subunit beta
VIKTLKEVPILILANKQDVKEALNEEQITKQYSLHEVKEHSWRLQGCSAV